MKLPKIENKEIFHAYDVRGIFPDQLNREVAYKIAHAYFAMTPGERFVIAFDMRASSDDLFQGFVAAANDLGKRIESIGMTTTDMLYFALGKFEYDGGVMITASHNPKIWNGIKMMGKEVVPIDMVAIKAKYEELKTVAPADLATRNLSFTQKDYSEDYIKHVLNFINPEKIERYKIVVDAGNGMGGVNAAKVFSRLEKLEIVDMYFEPNSDFPHHQSNPAIPENTKELSEVVVSEKADFGIAFDGDGDRCFFVDEEGKYIPGHEIVALVAKILLKREPGQKVAFEYRNTYAIRYEIAQAGGIDLPIKAGHSFFKKIMHEENALFGGESSSHFYFRDNYYADNGVLPFLLVLEYLSESKLKLSEALKYYHDEFFSSGEMNFVLFEDISQEKIYETLQKAFDFGEVSFPDGMVMNFDNWRFNARMSNTEPILRLNIESKSKSQLEKSILLLHEEMSEFGLFIGNISPGSLEDLQLTVNDKFKILISNLWFTWNPHYILPLINLYGDGWRKNTPPGEFMSQYGKKRLENVLNKKAWEIDQNIRLFRSYMDEKEELWFKKIIQKEGMQKLGKLLERPVAYFSMEYGLIDWLQIYSGGLGVLAGDYIKQASDMGVPIVAVGIFYHQGYFHQDFDEHGKQIETYIAQIPTEHHLEPVKDQNGNPVEVKIEILDHDVFVKAWKLKVGRVDLILLDTNTERNEKVEDRMISAHLYGGDQDTRIRQEILLGIGGPRMLEAVGIKPSLFHMNEGHSGFLVLEMARRYVEESGMNFQEAISKVGAHLVFTNHTLKPAGNDVFPKPLFTKFFNTYLDNFRTDIDTLYELGKDDQFAKGDFSMTILGLRNAKISNAVSILHGVAAKKLWPEFKLLPITNGVHMPTWIAYEIHALIDKYVGENWHNPVYDVDFSRVQRIPDAELWRVHMLRKEKLIASINSELDLQLDPGALTVAWSRRLAEYKRPDLITSNLDRLRNLTSNTGKPIQILIAGKAHPRDTQGKELLQHINQSVLGEEFKNKVVIVPGYNWQLARRMVAGADIWLNTPYRFEEASGTSGMKAAANGVIQLTTLDGWTDEVDWFKKGWVVTEEDPSKSLHDILEYQAVPLYFDRGVHGYNEYWLEMMKNSMQLVLENYSTQRMMKDYLEKVYMPVLDD